MAMDLHQHQYMGVPAIAPGSRLDCEECRVVSGGLRDTYAFHQHGVGDESYMARGDRRDCAACYPAVVSERATAAIYDQENRIRVAIDDLVEFLNVMGAD